MKKYLVFIILSASIAFTSCNQIKFSEEQAKEVIISELGTPKQCIYYVYLSADEDLRALQNAGAITDYLINNNNFYDNYIKVPESNKQFYLGKRTDKYGGWDYIFKMFDIDFNKVEGISINKENQTAVVRFSIKFINITPFGSCLKNYNDNESANWYYIDNINNPMSFELNFRKFDSGWKIEKNSDQSNISFLNYLIYQKVHR